MGLRANIRDALILFICAWLLSIWIKKAIIPFRLGLLVLLLFLITVWFFLERMGLVKRFL